MVEVVKSRAFQIVYTWGLHWPWKSTTQQNSHPTNGQCKYGPKKSGKKTRQNVAGLLSEACPVFQLGQFTAKGSSHVFFFFPNMMYVLLHVTHWAKRVCISRKKKERKANTSMIYMDAVVSTIKGRILTLQPTSEGNRQPCIRRELSPKHRGVHRFRQ